MGGQLRVAFLNLCHCDPGIVARTARRLTESPYFDMYVHVDAKQKITPFKEALEGLPQVYFTKKRCAVYWGGYGAVLAEIELLRAALSSGRHYDRYMLLQNLDYPLMSNKEIQDYFLKYRDKEFIRACRIAGSRDWHFAEKYRLYHSYDDPYYLTDKKGLKKYVHAAGKIVNSWRTIRFDGVIREEDGMYPIYYGAAQWAVTEECAEYFVHFFENHPIFNRIMRHVKFPDEEYFHTIVHNCSLKDRCIYGDEPQKRWLVNWRNLHYFEYPKEITIFQEQDYEKLICQDAMFIRKVRSGISDGLLDKLDKRAGKE